MIISDLEHLEVVAEETSIVGGGKKSSYKDLLKKFKKEEHKPKIEVAVADASADSLAVGDIAVTDTKTETVAVAGQFAASSSNSSAFAANN